MNATPDKPPFRRPLYSGPFFDYVREAAHEYAKCERAQLARLAASERRLSARRQGTAEQRWEGEGGSTAETLSARQGGVCEPGGA